MLVEPGLQSAGALPCGVFRPGRVSILELAVGIEGRARVGSKARRVNARAVF